MAKVRRGITIDKLAAMVQGGFEEMGKSFEELKKGNEREHEEIKLKLDNVAYRFEVVELQRRVSLLERKMLHRKFVAR